VEFLDQFRGFTIALMILVNLMSGFTITPRWLKHATVMGSITITDFVITMFMFAIGVAMELTFSLSRARIGTPRTVWRHVRRNLLLIGFGLLGSVILRRDLVGEWGVFQAIGGAGLVVLPFMFLHPGYRVVAAVAMVGAYELIGAAGHWTWLLAHDTGHLGGIPGALAWAGVMLIASISGWFIRKRAEAGFRRSCVVIAVAGIGLALALRGILPVFKPLITVTYLLVTTGFAALILFIFAQLNLRFLPLRVLGRNALAVFMLHGILVEAAPRLLSPASPVPVVLTALAVVYALCFLLAGLLYTRRISIRL
jgi:predicted acyltransferase